MISLTSPVETLAHQWPAGLKLGILCLSTIFLYSINNFAVELVFLGIVILLYAIPGRAFMKHGLSQLSILWPFVLIVLVWHIWTGDFLVGAGILVRLVCAVALANLVTMTTRLSDMIDVVHFLAKPFERFGLNPRILELSIALVIRMTPILLSKGQGLAMAWRARSLRRSGWRIILPFTLVALDDADHVAEALRARGGHINNSEKH